MSPSRYFWVPFCGEIREYIRKKEMVRQHLKSWKHIWVFPKIGVPPKHPRMIIFGRKTHGCWVPPFLETSILLNKKHQGIDVGLPCFGCLLFASRHHEDMGGCGRMRPDMEPDDDFVSLAIIWMGNMCSSYC